MYEYVKGILKEMTPLYAVVDVGGVGYKLSIPVNLLGKGPDLEKEVIFYTSWVVREQSQTLYGFFEKGERDFFEVLITLSGVGPKTGLCLIGHLGYNELMNAVERGNAAALSKVPGIGKKTAERLCIDLRGKHIASSQSTSSGVTYMRDALQALINLGYGQNAAEKALQAAVEESPQEEDLSLLITSALKHCKR